MVLVLVHVGSHFPDYIVECIEQIRIFNPTIQIYLGVDAVNVGRAGKVLEPFNVTVIDLSLIPKTSEHKLFERNSTHDAVFRGGFWRFTTERFLVLYDIVSHYDLRDIIHLENDQMVYCDLLELLPVFRENYKIAIPFDSPCRAIPSIVYFREREHVALLAGFLSRKAGDNIDDMHIMREFQRAYPGIMHGLPIASPDLYSDEQYTHCYDRFKSVFDAACMGQYLGGIDPRNMEGDTRGFVNTDTPIRADSLSLHFRRDAESGLWVPYASGSRVNNLHIHCKNLKKFLSSNISIDQ